MIFLMDTYTENSNLLAYSLEKAGYQIDKLVIQYDGYLQDGFCSPYAFYVGDEDRRKNSLPDPLYFDQLQVPDYWEISGTNSMGKVNNFNQVRANIYYAEPKRRRFVKIVDWLDQNGKVRCSDHYNQYGMRFARTVLSEDERMICKSYFDRLGNEVIFENFITGSVMTNKDGEHHAYSSKADFILDYIVKRKLNYDRVMYNSLSTPFFVVQKLNGCSPNRRNDILFWQEPIRDTIPGNMQVLLNDSNSGTKRIVAQTRNAFSRMMKLLGDNPAKDRITCGGFIYNRNRKNEGSPNALILTNSDQIEQIDYLAQNLPEMTFHIVAITEMSPLLLSKSSLHNNIKTYPGATDSTIERLYQSCDYYLDINHGNELMNAVRRAIFSDHLVFAFDNTAHNRDYVTPENILNVEKKEDMVRQIRGILNDSNEMKSYLERQNDFIMCENEERFRALVDI